MFNLFSNFITILDLPSLALSLALLLGLIAGELVSKFRYIPRVLGYLLIGYLLGPGVLGVFSKHIFLQFHMLLNIAVGMILFDLGRNLDFSWLRHQPQLLLMSLTESLLTFGVTYLLFHALGLPWFIVLLVSCIAMTTAPGVVLSIVADLSSQGPVTRHTTQLTGLNNVLGYALFTILLPISFSPPNIDVQFFISIVYHFVGAIILSIIMFFIMRTLAILIGKNKQNQFILLFGTALLTIVMAHSLHVGIMLSLLLLGVATHNFDHKHILSEVSYGWISRIFYIIVFVLLGTFLDFINLWHSIIIVLLFIGVRLCSKMIGIHLFANTIHLTKQQANFVSLALYPMSGITLMVCGMLETYSRDVCQYLHFPYISAIIFIDLIGPIMTQYAFIKSGETTTPERVQGKIS